MSSLYLWLKYLHLVGLTGFIFGHGIAGGSALMLRSRPAAALSRALLGISIWSYRIAYPGLLLLVVTGVWMAFLAALWGRAWVWAAIAVLVVVLVVMGALSAPYHGARDVGAEDDAALEERLSRTRPLATAWVGSGGLLLIIFLMVFKPF